MRKFISEGALAASMFVLLSTAASAGTLDDVKKKGFPQCGVNTGLAGFAAPNDKGEWTGFDVDYCRAVSAAIFGDATKVKFTPLSAKDRFPALQSGEIDFLARNTTWTLSRDTQGMDFIGANYSDGSGFMINTKKLPGINSALQLSGASVCVQTGTTNELVTADYFKAHAMEYQPVVVEKLDEVKAAYNSGRCDVYSTDKSQLYSIRLSLSAPSDHIVLPEIFSKEPLGPATRQGDSQWTEIIRWTHYALLTTQELGITQGNADELAETGGPEIKRVPGQEVNTKLGTDLGLTTDWVTNIVKAVGNYGEIFDRNLGAGSPLRIDRGINALWSKGGLQYAMPIR